MPNKYWCTPCGQMWETEEGSHRDWECPLNKEMNDYFDNNADKAYEIKDLLTWFNSFKTLQEYLKNDEDIETIDRGGFYHEERMSILESRLKDVFEELRKRYQRGEKSFENKPINISLTNLIGGAEVEFKDKEKELNYLVSSLATKTLDDIMSSSSTDNYKSYNVRRTKLGSSTHHRYPIPPEENYPDFKDETASTFSRPDTSSTLSSKTKQRLETKIEKMENKLETIETLLKQLVKQKNGCSCNENGFVAQIVQPDK